MTDDTRRQSILCPNCRRLIGGNIPQCPYCGITAPGTARQKIWYQGFLQSDRLLSAIILVNVGMYILTLVMNPSRSLLAFNPLHFLAPDNRSLLIFGATGTVPVVQLHRWWTLLSANYLHGGLLHILFNMMALKQLGPLVILEFGSSRTLVIYTLGGAAGYLVSVVAGVPFTIGASASVCALLGATLYFGKSRGGVYGQAVFSQIGSWAVGIFLFGLVVPGINNWGHGGGILAGIALAALLGYREKLQEQPWHKALGGFCLLATAAVLAWAIFTGIIYYLQAFSAH